MNRREAITLLIGTMSSAGVWRDGAFSALPRRVDLALAGECSFCLRKGAAAGALVSSCDHPVRICQHCLSFAAAGGSLPETSLTPPPLAMSEEIEIVLAALGISGAPGQADYDRRVREFGALMTSPTPRPRPPAPTDDLPAEPRCAFCLQLRRTGETFYAGVLAETCSGCLGIATEALKRMRG